ncbi:unnamed protein product [Triticum turgidum subsp. durum]|uniref:Terpene synthase metal-binding domain-containing protein n=1 Tax=Triticum turgidum subsp. durum TaxID=4567 RepID=A0A9R1NLQ8_TRITD|nr:unnamed protein product [Triticum turgidum subsp. durum]
MAVSLTPTPPILFSSPFFSSAIATRGNYSSRLPLQASPRPCFPHVQASPVAAKSTPSSSIEQETTDVDYDDVAPKTLSSYGPSLWGDYFLNYEPKPLQAYTTPTAGADELGCRDGFLHEYSQIIEQYYSPLGHVGLNYAQDRLVEGYIWCYAVYHEKDFALSRIFLTKQLMLISLMDDTYDSHATIEECRLLNAAIQRWDESATSLLPNYLQRFYIELLRIFNEHKREVAIRDTYHVAYARKFQDLSAYYLQEAEWLHQNHKPSFKDHMSLSAMSIGSPTLCIGLMVGMGDLVTRESFEWAAGYPNVTISCGKIACLMDDIVAFKGGKAKGDIATSIECYMVEHRVTSAVAISKILSLLEDDWKTLNQALFQHHAQLPMVRRIINFANSMPLFYAEKDAYTFNIHLKDTVESLFVETIPM